MHLLFIKDMKQEDYFMLLGARMVTAPGCEEAFSVGEAIVTSHSATYLNDVHFLYVYLKPTT